MVPSSKSATGRIQVSTPTFLFSYVVDFVCIEKRLVIELDGGQHARAAEADERRTKFLEQKGFSVVRFWNNEVLGNTEAVLERILELLN